MDAGAFAAAALVLVWAALFLRAWQGIARTPRVRPRAGASDSIQAFVPARDEAEVIEASVRALCAQDGVSQVVVVDDQSSDDTPRILTRLTGELPKLGVLHGRGPPPGACGKPAALEFATSQVELTAPWLLFLDADVVLEPGALAGLLDLQRETDADLLSVLPRLELPSLLEEVVMPAVAGVITARYRPEWVNDPAHPVAFANGQLILVRREVYAAIGGHGSVRSEVLEDVRLAERVKAAGYRLCVADGRLVARTRMYASFAEMVEGWSKNLYLLVGAKWSRAVGWALLTAFLGTAPLTALLLGGVPAGIAAYLAILGLQMMLRGRGGVRARFAVLAPVGALLAGATILRSAWLHTRRRRVAWKGRSYGDSA